MKHWSVDEERFKRLYPEKYRRWRIEQRVNLGVGTWKLNRAELTTLWGELDLDEDRKRTLEWFLWPKRS
ncbi:MAG: hypothetical protein WC654_06815 [Patescibacteria group bacterium]